MLQCYTFSDSGIWFSHKLGSIFCPLQVLFIKKHQDTNSEFYNSRLTGDLRAGKQSQPSEWCQPIPPDCLPLIFSHNLDRFQILPRLLASVHFCMLDQSQSLYQCARAAITKCHQLLGLKKQHFFFSQCWMEAGSPKIKVLPRLVSFQACEWPSSLHVFTWSFLCGCLCPNLLFF